MIAREYDIFVDDTFDLRKTLFSGQCFHFIETGNSFLVFGEDTVCRVCQIRDVVKLYCNEKDFPYWKNYFTLEKSYMGVLKYLTHWAQKKRDIFALQSINMGKGIRILNQPLFETCCSFILSQQNNIPRIQKMIFNLSEKYSSKKVYLGEEVYCCFPSPKDLKNVSVLEYRELGFGYRSEYIYEFVQNWNIFRFKISKKFWYSMNKEALLTCRGIGNKVADCICLYGLHNLDAFPIDTWMKKILKEEYLDNDVYFVSPEKYAGILQQFMFYTKRNSLKKR